MRLRAHAFCGERMILTEACGNLQADAKLNAATF
jgi:hypothetical protein